MGDVTIPADVARAMASFFRQDDEGPNAMGFKRWADLLDPQPPTLRDDRAVQAVAEAIVRIVHRDLHPDGEPCRLCDVAAPEMARAAVAAAREVIEAEVRERIAAEIEAEFIGQDHHEPTFNSGRDAGLRLAARIASGTVPCQTCGAPAPAGYPLCDKHERSYH